MGIQIERGKARRDWTKIALAGAEAVAQAIALGPNGFSNAVSALFRAMEGLRGEDSTELRAKTLVMETLGYAAAEVLATAPLGRRPEAAEAKFIIQSILSRAETLASQRKIVLESEHLGNPECFPLFHDAATRIYSELKLLKPKETKADLAALFRTAVTEGMNRVRTRNLDYFASVFDALSGPDGRADARTRAWSKYRAELMKRFEDEPLFGEDGLGGVTLGQVYQPLRT